MARLRVGRRKYYDLFSHFYDAFIRLHAGQDEDDTRHFLVDAAHLEEESVHRILDLCCGTGSVVLAFVKRCPDALLVGCDFSHGMLRKAQEKTGPTRAVFVEGDAAHLPFADGSFNVVTCSHALYELKGQAREQALREMKRVMHSHGVVLIMEHEMPSHPVMKLLFHMRLLFLGFHEGRDFIEGGLQPLKKIFSRVTIKHSRSGRSRLMVCKE